MAQIINTNISSLNAQRNLTTSQSALATSLQRLSSGLRINSAKDDAAGLAIADRMTSQIRGLNQAVRNANDGISLAQTAEGALSEMGNILQRMRELAIQSANATNSATDRASLQSEVNQLKSELSRIATSTTFNGKTLLDGTLQQEQFQVGAEANQTIQMSVSDARATGLGTYAVTSSVNTTTTTNGIQANNGLEAATRVGHVRSNGALVGIPVAAAAGSNGYLAETITQTSPAGVQTSASVLANDSAKEAAAAIDGLSGVSATATTLAKFAFGGGTGGDAGDQIVIGLGDNAGAVAGTTVTVNLNGVAAASVASTVATAINADTEFVAAGGFARVNTSGQLEIVNTSGYDVTATFTDADADLTATMYGYDGGSAWSAGQAMTTATAYITAGYVDVYVDQGYSISSSIATSLFTSTTPTVTAVGAADASAGNGVAEQVLTITGTSGSATVNVDANQSAYSIAASINEYEASTGVEATARTTAYLGDLSATGTVSFSLQGSNSTAVAISANMTGTTNLIDLVTAINAKTGDTGITAKLTTISDSGSQFTNDSVIELTQADGYDIKITNFEHSAAVDNGTAGTSSTYSNIAAEQSIKVMGNEGVAVSLYDGGDRTGADSSVLGGQLTFNASGAFNVSSNIAGSVGSVFSGAASSSNASTLSTVNAVDVSSVSGANDAISVFDGALAQINTIRSELGAFQNRFESTIANLQATSENVSNARSRVQDADFAMETANLTRAQILQQAGIAMLAQANAVPNQVLTLLRG